MSKTKEKATDNFRTETKENGGNYTFPLHFRESQEITQVVSLQNYTRDLLPHIRS